MAKIKRNDPCPCGSGRKYKKCCLNNTNGVITPAPHNVQVSLKSAVENIKQAAAEGRETVRCLGVFILFATGSKDAWLLEITDMDAVQAVKAGEVLSLEIAEDPVNLEINWTHKFAFQKQQFTVTAYNDNTRKTFADYPVKKIQAEIKKARQRIPQALIDQIHVDGEDTVAVTDAGKS